VAAIPEADIVTTAVGSTSLELVAPAISASMAGSFSPLGGREFPRSVAERCSPPLT
jgi:hypothetical protein